MSSLSQDLDVLTALARGDIFIITRDPDGTPVDERAGIEDVFALMPNLTTVVFKSEVDLATFLQVLANDDSIVLNVDTVNERVGVGVLPLSKLDVQGPGSIALNISSTDAAGITSIEIGAQASGNRFAIIDLHGDDTFTDFSFRLLRKNTGDNADTELNQRGTGVLRLVCQEAGSIQFATTNLVRMTLDALGNVAIGASAFPSAGGSKVLVFGDNAGAPTMGADTGGVFADDVAGTVETFATDEDSNATQLTPHAKDAHEEMHLDTDLQHPRIRRTVFPLLERIVFYRDDTRIEISETFADYNARRGLIEGQKGFLKGKTHEEVEDEREAVYEAKRAAAIAAGEPDPGPYVRKVEDPAYATYRDRAEGLGTVKRVDSIVVSMGS